MPAKLHFAARRKPTEFIVVAARNEIGGLRKIVSAATESKTLSSNHSTRGHTAAGLPANGLAVKAST